MLLLEELDLIDALIKDLYPLSLCKNLKKLSIDGHSGNGELEDLSPLSRRLDLECLSIFRLHLIEDLYFLDDGFSKLRVL